MNAQSKLTVAFLLATPGTTWGGMERHTADLAKALASCGHQIHVLGHRAYRDRFPSDIRFHALPVHLGRRNPWLAMSIRRQLRHIAPDIFHAQGNKAAQLTGTVRRFRGVTVGTLHGTKSSHKAFHRLDRVIAVSPKILETLEHDQKQLIYNGIELAGPSESPGTDLPQSARNVIAVGRLEPVKGFDRLIRAWAESGSENENNHLTIFGEGSQHQQLKALVNELGLNGQVTLAGYCNNLAPVYKQAAATVISSKREGFPYVLVESLHCGCPVLSTPVAGATDLLPADSLSNGYDASAIRDLLTRSLADLKALNRTQESAMAFARETLTLQTMTTQTERLYLEALKAQP